MDERVSHRGVNEGEVVALIGGAKHWDGGMGWGGWANPAKTRLTPKTTLALPSWLRIEFKTPLNSSDIFVMGLLSQGARRDVFSSFFSSYSTFLFPFLSTPRCVHTTPRCLRPTASDLPSNEQLLVKFVRLFL